MEKVPSDHERAPQIELTQTFANRSRAGEQWSLGWKIENRGDALLKVLTIHLPHGQFKAGEHRFAPPVELAPGQRNEFTTLVRCDEPPGLVTENAFLILNVVWLDNHWRIFVRIRVSVLDDGRPETKTESITSQKVGFSGITS